MVLLWIWWQPPPGDKQDAACDHVAHPVRSKHREVSPSLIRRSAWANSSATLALAQDNAFGQPLESQLRSCLLATWMCDQVGYDDDVRTTAYWLALLRYLGCTGHAHEVATVFGDEIAIRAQTLVHDAANPAEVMRDVMAYATAGHSPDERDQIVKMIQETSPRVGGQVSGGRGRCFSCRHRSQTV